MSDEIGLGEQELILRNSAETEVEAKKGSPICHVKGRGWLEGILPMSICCAVPLLLAGAIALFGISLSALESGFLRIAALLACPVGMYLMMRMMMKDKK
jgi:hypothetical protein